MSGALRVVLAGIVLILASLFFMGICILNANAQKGGPEGLALALFVAGVIVSIIGLFLVKEENKDEE